MYALKLKENHSVYPSEWPKWQRQKIPTICKDLGQLEFLYMTDESINCYNHFENGQRGSGHMFHVTGSFLIYLCTCHTSY